MNTQGCSFCWFNTPSIDKINSRHSLPGVLLLRGKHSPISECRKETLPCKNTHYLKQQHAHNCMCVTVEVISLYKTLLGACRSYNLVVNSL